MNSARSRQRRWRRKNKIITSFLFFAFMSQHTFTDIPNSPQLSRFTTGWDDGGFSFIEQYCTSLSIEALIKHGNWRCVRAMSMGMLTSLHWFFSLNCCKSSPLFYMLDWNYFVSLLFSFFAQDNLKIFFFPHKSFFTLIFFLCNTLIFALFLLAFFHRDFLWIFTQKKYFTSLRLTSALTRSQLKLFWPALARMHGSIQSNWKRRLGRAEETCTKWRRKSVKMSRSRRLVLCREREREHG